MSKICHSKFNLFGVRTVALSGLSTFVLAYYAVANVTPVQAEETPVIQLPETVITATRSETPIEKVGRSVEARSAEELAVQQNFTLSETLQTVSGLRTLEIGGPGSPGVTPFEIRGFRSGGTQFLLNGLRYNDPSSVSGTAESFSSYFLVNDLSGVEVLKGATSSLYGSDGQAGAVNFLTRTPTQGSWAEVSLQGGSFGTFQESLTANAGTDSLGMVATISRVDSDGIDTHGNLENTSVLVSGTAKLTDNVTIEPIIRLINARSDLDTGPTLDPSGGFIPSQDTPKDNLEARHLFLGTTAIVQPDTDFTSKLSLYTNDSHRDFFFDFGGFPSPFNYKGRSFNVDWQNSYRFEELNSELTGGFDFEHQSADSDSPELSDGGRQDRYGLFVNISSGFLDDSLEISAGGRVSHISSIDKTLPTLELAAVYQIPNTPLRAHSSIAQGFRAPTVYETDGLVVDYNSGQIVNVGNRDLDAEESLTFDAGLALDLGSQSVIDVTVFNTHSDESILFDFANLKHVNGGSVETQGIETSITYQPTSWLIVRSGFTHLAKADGLDHQRLQRRPYNIWATSVTAAYEKATLFAEYRYRGDQKLAFFGTSEQFKEGDSNIVNATVSYQVLPQLQAFVRGSNIFDHDYTESGYKMPGVGVFGGIRIGLGDLPL